MKIILSNVLVNVLAAAIVLIGIIVVPVLVISVGFAALLGVESAKEFLSYLRYHIK